MPVPCCTSPLTTRHPPPECDAGSVVFGLRHLSLPETPSGPRVHTQENELRPPPAKPRRGAPTRPDSGTPSSLIVRAGPPAPFVFCNLGESTTKGMKGPSQEPCPSGCPRPVRLNHSDRSTVTFQESPALGSIRILRFRNFFMTSAFVRRWWLPFVPGSQDDHRSPGNPDRGDSHQPARTGRCRMQSVGTWRASGCRQALPNPQ